MTDTIHATDSDGARCGAFGATFDGDASEGSGEAVVDANTAPLDGGMGVEARVRAVVAAFAGIDAEGVTPAERVACVAALEAVKGAAAAAQARLTAAVVTDREGLGEDTRSVRADLALARRCSPTVADQHVGVAKALVEEMPHTLAALTSGDLSERRAHIMVRETACLSREHRAAVDATLAAKVTKLGDKALAAAAKRAGAALDSESLAARARRAVASRRVTVRPAPDGMAWLSILGPMKDVIGAHVALMAEEARRNVIDPDLPAEQWEAAAAAARADTRGKGAWLVDRALELLSGRAQGQPQPVAVNLVMTDRTLIPAAFGGRAPADDTATIPGWGVVPGQAARDWVASNLDHPSTNDAGTDSTKSGFVWLRRLFTDPTGRDLVAMDSRQRRFHGGLRRFLELRDPTCRVPWCDAPAVHVDHARSVHDGGATSAGNGDGLCERHNQVKEHDGWHFTVQSTGLDGTGPHHLRIHTPTGTSYDSTAPPIHGEGWTPPTLRDSAHDWIPDHATEAWHDDWHDAWADPVHLEDRPLPHDPLNGWIPDPPEHWLAEHDESYAA